ncbi:MAG: hypothetical protein Kow00117_02350 [Phototrophicales bacterium]
MRIVMGFVVVMIGLVWYRSKKQEPAAAVIQKRWLEIARNTELDYIRNTP